MPSRGNNSQKRRRGGGELRNIIASSIMIILIIAGLLAFFRAQDIRDVGGAIDFARDFGTEAMECFSTLIGTNEIECPWGSDSDDASSPDGSPSAPSPDGFIPDADFGNDYAINHPQILVDIATNDDPEDTDYDRTQWRHWTGAPCNTRQEVLIEQGENVQTGDRCRIVSGTWFDPFTGETTDDSSSLDIDHIVPLGYADLHGGWQWDAEQKERFANDPINLRAVSASENRSKGADDLSGYVPPNEDYHCEYAQIWVEVLGKYNLSTTTENKDALSESLTTCE